jgi:RNA polymerase sigma factor (sigma-70 family)
VSNRVATTQWSQVLAARDGTETEARRALETLCQTYWQPVYAFIRHLGSDPEEARDLAQAYFAELLEKDFLAGVDADRGRFRSFLFTSVRHFLYHQRDRSKALKRGGGTTTLSLDMASAEAGYSMQPRAQMTPEDVFEHRWAMTVLSRALRRLQAESKRSGNERQFEQLKAYLTSGDSQVPYRDAAEILNLSEGAVKVAVHRLRKRFGQCLRAELAETVVEVDDVDTELRHMLSILGGQREAV